MAKSKRSRRGKINNLIVVSDLHCGCRMGLYPPEPIKVDDGGTYQQSKLQATVWSWWDEFWNEWVPHVTKGEPYAVAVNGDVVDGSHHNSTTQISQNLADQEEIGFRVLRPVYERCEGRMYYNRGTEAHGGQSGVDEERLARRLGCIPDSQGQHSRWLLWARVGRGLVNIAHHIGTTGSMAYETSAVMKELEQIYADAGRWNREIPDVVIRSHRHRNVEVSILTYKGYAKCAVTAAWQLKTPFAHRMPGGRITEPQIGGTLIRCGDEDVYTRHYVRSLERPPVEVL